MTLPPLDASDTLVRTLVQALTESPAVMAWLPTLRLVSGSVARTSQVAPSSGAVPSTVVPSMNRTEPVGRPAPRGTP